MRKFIFLTLIISLSGCVKYQWIKPGADKHRENIDETKCTAQALRDLPPDNIITGKYTLMNKKNNGTDTRYSTNDANESKRYILVNDCMHQKGWRRVESKY